MDTEQSATAIEPDEGAAGWSDWIAPFHGLWVLVSPFVLVGFTGAGNPLYST